MGFGITLPPPPEGVGLVVLPALQSFKEPRDWSLFRELLPSARFLPSNPDRRSGRYSRASRCAPFGAAPRDRVVAQSAARVPPSENITPWGYHDRVATTVTSSHRHWLDFGVSGTSRYTRTGWVCPPSPWISCRTIPKNSSRPVRPRFPREALEAHRGVRRPPMPLT